MRIEQAPWPAIEKPDDVLIHISHTGICGSELHAIEGYELSKGALGGAWRHQTWGTNTPAR